MKIVAFILSFVIFFNAVVPCTVIDNCDQEELVSKCCDKACEKEDQEPKEEKGCSDCPPFSICSAAYEFTAVNNYATPVPATPYSSIEFFEYHFSFNSGYYSTLFQPPRLS